MNPVIAAVVMGGLGLIFGSFIAAVSVRLPRDEDIVLARSRCRGATSPCVRGNWFRCSAGWRCAGGAPDVTREFRRGIP